MNKIVQVLRSVAWWALHSVQSFLVYGLVVAALLIVCMGFQSVFHLNTASWDQTVAFTVGYLSATFMAVFERRKLS